MNLHDLFDGSFIVLTENTFPQVVRKMVESLLESHPVETSEASLNALVDGVHQREERGSTAIGNGVCLPHCKSADITTSCLVSGKHEAGIEVQTSDGVEQCHFFYLLVSPEEPKGEHLEALRVLSQGLSIRPDLREITNEEMCAEAV